jgi:hypothetical protein
MFNIPSFESIRDQSQRIPGKYIIYTCSSDCRGGGTGREFVENLSNDGHENWNKWYASSAINDAWVQLDFTGPFKSTIVGKYRICTANDCARRDPVSWRLLGLTCEPSPRWITLHDVCVGDGLMIFPTDRWVWREFEINEQYEVSAVRLEISQVRQVNDGIQLGHLHILPATESLNSYVFK